MEIKSHVLQTKQEDYKQPSPTTNPQPTVDTPLHPQILMAYTFAAYKSISFTMLAFLVLVLSSR